MSDREKSTEDTRDEQGERRPQFRFVLDGTCYESIRELECRGNGELFVLARRRLQHGPAGYVAVRTLRSPSQFVHRGRTPRCAACSPRAAATALRPEGGERGDLADDLLGECPA
jgi:hypothetical protein